ncbi:hypothetical protein GCM10028809_09310 [Spirosoma gilvum]
MPATSEAAGGIGCVQSGLSEKTNYEVEWSNVLTCWVNTSNKNDLVPNVNTRNELLLAWANNERISAIGQAR